MNKIKVLSMLLLLLLLSGCSDTSNQTETVSEELPLSTKEPAKQRHVDMYLSKEAYSECRRVGKKLKVGRNAANVINNHKFIVQNEENSIKAILVCEHGYSERINMWSYASYDTETKPVYYIMSKKYDENNRLIALKLLEKVVLIN